MVLRLTSPSPRCPGLLDTVARASSRRLDAGPGASERHDFAVRTSTIRQLRCRVHRIPPRVRDDRETPLWGTGRQGIYIADLGLLASVISEFQKPFGVL